MQNDLHEIPRNSFDALTLSLLLQHHRQYHRRHTQQCYGSLWRHSKYAIITIIIIIVVVVAAAAAGLWIKVTPQHGYRHHHDRRRRRPSSYRRAVVVVVASRPFAECGRGASGWQALGMKIWRRCARGWCATATVCQVARQRVQRRNRRYAG